MGKKLLFAPKILIFANSGFIPLTAAAALCKYILGKISLCVLHKLPVGIGFMLFQMIFEAGNRYFMIYTPFVVLLAVGGLRAMGRAAGRRKQG